MPRMGDMWYEALRKLNNGEQLSNEEMEAVRFAGNNTQATNDLVNGWQSGIVRPDFAIDAVSNENIGFVLQRSAAQSIPDDTLTEISWDTGSYQDASFYDISADATQVTIPSTGWYQLLTFVVFGANGTGDRYIYWYTGGSLGGILDLKSGASGAVLSNAVEIRLTKGNLLDIRVLQDSTGALNLTAARWTMRKVLSPKSN